MSAPDRERRAELISSALLLGGAALLGLPARHYRLDLVTCNNWPADNAVYAAVFAIAIVMMGIGWWRHPAVSARRTFLVGVAVHLVALAWPPSLSHDPLFYAAVGRAMAWFGSNGQVPLDHALPAADHFLTVLPANWQHGQSPYSPGFDQLARLIAYVAGDRLWLALKLHQALGLVAMCATTAFTALSVERKDRARAIALVLLCPLGVVEATLSAHNDVFLAVSMALFVLAVSRNRTGSSLLALATSLAIKANALLPLLVRALELALRRVPVRRLRPAVWIPVAALTVIGATYAIVLVRTVPELGRFTSLIGSPDVPYDYCTRSIECLPRVIFRFVLHMPTAAWVVGIVFRLIGMVWLGYAAMCAARDRDSLRWMATALFVYYAFLHGWAQTWYLLPLLPLLPHASAALLPAMRLYCVTGVAYYALIYPYSCSFDHATKAVSDAVEAAITIIPPAILLLRARRATAARTTR